MNRGLHSLWAGCLASTVLLLQGCNTLSELGGHGPATAVDPQTGLPVPPTDPTQRPIAQGQPSLEQANALFQRGDKRNAAEMYNRVAFTHLSPQRERIILQAAEISASLGDQALTQRYLGQIPPAVLQEDTRYRYQYVQALLALQMHQATAALRLLPAETITLSPYLRDKVALVRKRALEMGGTAVTASPHPRTTNTPRQAPVLPASTNRLGILLPGTGALGAVGKEIYQGVKDAQAQMGGDVRSKLYEVKRSTVMAQYQKAVADGADLIIGPLEKDPLSELLENAKDLSVPILSLNYHSDGTPPALLYQFGLSPEDEARQVAEVALARGQRQAIVLVPDSIWGKRLAESFITTYEARGGQILNQTNYPNSATSSYLQRVQAALKAGDNAQMVFLGASPTQARLLRPLLQAQASNLPVYATSHIFSGRLDPQKDTDLDGIIYTEIPYVLESIQSGSLNSLKFPRLYALGADAVFVARNLTPLTQHQTLRGKTGEISLSASRNIQRRLKLATFINGTPQPLD